MARPKADLVLPADERQKLTPWAKRPKSFQRLALRARLCRRVQQQGRRRETRLRTATVGTWRQRFITNRLDGLTDDPRPGAPRAVTDAHIEDIIDTLTDSKTSLRASLSYFQTVRHEVKSIIAGRPKRKTTK